MKYSDEEILKLIGSTDRKEYGFNVLVHMYQKRLYWVIRRMVITHEDADDTLQNVFLKVWKSIDSFKAESQIYTWVHRIAVNEALGLLRKKRKRFFIPMVDVEEVLASRLTVEDGFEGDEIQVKLQKAVLMLPEKQRLVFNLKYFEEMKYSDMSDVLSISEGGLKAQYHHAVKKIKEILEMD